MCERLSLLCPHCGNGLIKIEEKDEFAECQECSTKYPFSNGVLDLLVDKEAEMAPATRPMLWKWLVNIYDGSLWRKSKWMAWSFGIPFEKEYEVIEKSAHFTGNEMVLDMACGPGMYTLPFANVLNEGFAVGLDISMPMLEYGAWKAKESKIDNILFIHATVADLTFQIHQFDVVNCCGALHLFSDLPAVLSRVNDVLQPGGRFTLGAARQREGRLMQQLTAYLEKTRGLRCFTPQEMESLLEQAGFVKVTCHHAKGSWLIMSAEKST
jgi:ubiquinone/menaquinone biosynthesis C-methylase UbiE